MWKLKLDKDFINDYAITLGISVILALVNFYIFKLIAHHFTTDEFYLYSYAKRIIAFAIPLSFFGFGVALPKYVAKKQIDDPHFDTKKLLASSIIITQLIPIIGIILVFSFPKFFTNLLWGNSMTTTIVINQWIFVYISAIALYSIIYSYYRGKLFVLKANIFEIFTIGIFPIGLIYYSNTLVNYYQLNTFFVYLSDFIVLLFIFKFSHSFRFVKKETNEMFDFGIRRLPGDIVLYLFLLLPSFISARLYGIEAAGIIAFSGTLISLSQMPAQPVAFISLSRNVKLFHSEKEKLKKELLFLSLLMVTYSIIFVVIGELFIEDFIRWYLGKAYTEMIYLVKLMLFSVPGFVLFTTLRGTIDAVYHKAYNSRYSYIAMLIFIIVFTLLHLLNPKVENIIYAFIVGVYFLVGFQLSRILKIFKQ